jgi:hypothetical protein
MVLTNEELWANAVPCFATYHLDNGGVITNYEDCGNMVKYDYVDYPDDLKMKITEWDYSTTEPTVDYLKTTYSVSDFATVAHYLEDIQALQIQTVLFTTDRVFLTDYATQGNMVYNPSTNELYIFDGTAWRQIAMV